MIINLSVCELNVQSLYRIAFFAQFLIELYETPLRLILRFPDSIEHYSKYVIIGISAKTAVIPFFYNRFRLHPAIMIKW